MLHAPIPHRLVDDAEPPPRQCGRPCRASLLGRHPHPTGAAHRRRPPAPPTASHRRYVVRTDRPRWPTPPTTVPIQRRRILPTAGR
jgi:hypothetical protein